MASANYEAEVPQRGYTFLAGDVRRGEVFERQEVERALARYFELADEAAKSGDWNAWADIFTDDAIYIEHAYGVFRGREQIRRWVNSVTGSVPMDLRMTDEWHVIDNDLCIVYASNWRPAPDQGAPFQFNAVAILCYAGDGRWCYEEDLYNAIEARQVMEAFGSAHATHG